jgi:hypothetical protein
MDTPHGQVLLQYKPYGEPLAYPGVAELLARSTVLELCDLGERYLRETARQSEGSGLRPSVRAAIVSAYVGKAFAVRVRARSVRAEAVVRCTYRRPRPRQYRPRRVRVTSGPRRARAPGRPGCDDPHPEPVAVPQARP